MLLKRSRFLWAFFGNFKSTLQYVKYILCILWIFLKVGTPCFASCALRYLSEDVFNTYLTISKKCQGRVKLRMSPLIVWKFCWHYWRGLLQCKAFIETFYGNRHFESSLLYVKDMLVILLTFSNIAKETFETLHHSLTYLKSFLIFSWQCWRDVKDINNAGKFLKYSQVALLFSKRSWIRRNPVYNSFGIWDIFCSWSNSPFQVLDVHVWLFVCLWMEVMCYFNTKTISKFLEHRGQYSLQLVLTLTAWNIVSSYNYIMKIELEM